MSKYNNNEFELAKFIFNHSHIEAQLFWQRNNFFFLVNTALLGGSFYSIFIPKEGIEITNELRVMICLAGLISSIFWLLMNKASKDLNHSLAEDLKDVIKGDPYLKSKFVNTYKTRPLSATKLNHWFIVCFVVAWTYILLRPMLLT